MAKTRTIKISKDRDLLLSERFDRTKEGRRIHFASAMSLLGLDDGAGSSTGYGYLDIVDFILRGCTDVRQNLRELYRRVTFNVMFGNTDGKQSFTPQNDRIYWHYATLLKIKI